MIPNKTPMTKSQTVMVTMILMMVIYSILSGFRITKTALNPSIEHCSPAHSVPRVPQRLLHKIDTKNKNKRTNNHDSCMCDTSPKDSPKEFLDARMYAIGQVPITKSKNVAIASINPETRFPPPTR